MTPSSVIFAVEKGETSLLDPILMCFWGELNCNVLLREAYECLPNCVDFFEEHSNVCISDWFFFFFWRGNDSRLYYLRNMIYNGKEREGHVTLSFSFATLAYVKVARLHRKEKKKRTKKKLQNPNYCKKSEFSLGCPENQKKCQTTPS